MAAKGILALCADGRITRCTAPPERRGVGNCPHVAHQEEGEDDSDFIQRASQIAFENEEKEQFATVDDEKEVVDNPIGEQEVQDGRQKLFDLLGTEDVTPENLLEVVGKLPPEKQNEVFRLGFQYSSYFAYPLDFDKDDGESALVNKISLSNAGQYPQLGAKQKHIDAIMHEVGDYVTASGTTHISSNYRDGIDEDEWWSMMYATRRASVAKTVTIADSGAPVWLMQLVEVKISC